MKKRTTVAVDDILKAAATAGITFCPTAARAMWNDIQTKLRKHHRDDDVYSVWANREFDWMLYLALQFQPRQIRKIVGDGVSDAWIVCNWDAPPTKQLRTVGSDTQQLCTVHTDTRPHTDTWPPTDTQTPTDEVRKELVLQLSTGCQGPHARVRLHPDMESPLFESPQRAAAFPLGKRGDPGKLLWTFSEVLATPQQYALPRSAGSDFLVRTGFLTTQPAGRSVCFKDLTDGRAFEWWLFLKSITGEAHQSLWRSPGFGVIGFAAVRLSAAYLESETGEDAHDQVAFAALMSNVTESNTESNTEGAEHTMHIALIQNTAGTGKKVPFWTVWHPNTAPDAVVPNPEGGPWRGAWQSLVRVRATGQGAPGLLPAVATPGGVQPRPRGLVLKPPPSKVFELTLRDSGHTPQTETKHMQPPDSDALKAYMAWVESRHSEAPSILRYMKDPLISDQ